MANLAQAVCGGSIDQSTDSLTFIIIIVWIFEITQAKALSGLGLWHVQDITFLCVHVIFYAYPHICVVAVQPGYNSSHSIHSMFPVVVTDSHLVDM